MAATAEATPVIPKPKNEDWQPGQKFDVPEEGDGARIFYESLREQKPASKMAEKWCLEHGLVNPDIAKVLAKKYAAVKK